MNINFIEDLEKHFKQSLQTAGSKLDEQSSNINNKKEEINSNTEELLVDINELLNKLDNKYIKIKQLENDNNKQDKLDILINNLETKKNKRNNNKDSIKDKKKDKELINKVNNANNNNKQIDQLNLLSEKIGELTNDSKLDKLLLQKVIDDMKKIMELVPENVEDEILKNRTFDEIKGGKFDPQYNNLDNKLNNFSNKYSKLLNKKSNLKVFVNNICDKYNNTSDCINTIFETLETINLTEQQIKTLDIDLNEIKNNNVSLLHDKQNELTEIEKTNKSNEELLSKINSKLQSNLKKYTQSYNKYIDIDNDVDEVYTNTKPNNNNNIEKVILEYDKINTGLLSKLDELTKENIELEMNKNNIRNDINDNKETIISLQTEVNDLKNQLQIIQNANKKRIDEFVEKLNSIKNEKLFLTENIDKLENKIKDIEKQKELLKVDYKNNSYDKDKHNNKDKIIEKLNIQISSTNEKLKNYKQMLEDANEWKLQINRQLLEIKDNLQTKIKNFEEVEIILKNIKDIDINQIKNTNLKNSELQFKIKDLSTQMNYLSDVKKNNEQRLLELNELINNDDLTIQETRTKLKEYRDSLVEDLTK